MSKVSVKIKKSTPQASIPAPEGAGAFRRITGRTPGGIPISVADKSPKPVALPNANQEA